MPPNKRNEDCGNGGDDNDNDGDDDCDGDGRRKEWSTIFDY